MPSPTVPTTDRFTDHRHPANRICSTSGPWSSSARLAGQGSLPHLAHRAKIARALSVNGIPLARFRDAIDNLPAPGVPMCSSASSAGGTAQPFGRKGGERTSWIANPAGGGIADLSVGGPFRFDPQLGHDRLANLFRRLRAASRLAELRRSKIGEEILHFLFGDSLFRLQAFIQEGDGCFTEADQRPTRVQAVAGSLSASFSQASGKSPSAIGLNGVTAGRSTRGTSRHCPE